jgi:RHS repeat-associated protein
MYKFTGSSLFFFHPDHLGSGTLLTDANGDAYQFFVNLPFGETLAEQKATGAYSNVYKFTGKELDSETGLYYLGARYYSPVDGIFLNVDPLAGSFPSWGPYVYTMDNPVRLTDPTGMAPEGPDDIIYLDHNGKETHRERGIFDANGKDIIVRGTDGVEVADTRQSFSSTRPSVFSHNASNSTNDDRINADDAVGYFGVGVNVGQEVMFSPTFNTWMGKDFKVRSQTWGGNGITGGKFKYAKATSQGMKGLGGLNYAVGAYNFISIGQQYSSGEITGKEAAWPLVSNAIGTFAPPIVSVPMAVGTEVGKRNAPEIEQGVMWTSEKIMSPILKFLSPSTFGSNKRQ